jgi:hypothetical protein
MLLSARPLIDVANVNTWQQSPVIEFTAGDAASVFFVIVNASLDRELAPSGRRYVPAAGATLQCSVEALDDTKKLTRFAVNPFPDDRSIWRLDFTTTDQIRGTASLRLRLTEGGVATTGYAKNILSVSSSTCL